MSRLPTPAGSFSLHRRRPLAITVSVAAYLLGQSLCPAADAEMCALDAVPAATLLLPYFEVDLDDEDGVTTLFTINNATPEPTLAHVTFWTNLSQPTMDFDVFLTGYDTQAVNLREVFGPGNLPITADEQSDALDTISPHGTHPEWDGSFTAAPDCANFFPFYVNPLIVGSIRERVINGHTGQPISSLAGNCLGADLGDNVARGYITIDHSQRCSVFFPSDPGYFGGPEQVTSDENRIWGDFTITHPTLGFEASDTLVHIEADPAFDQTSTSSGYTFYGRFSGGADHREPLASQWGVRYIDSGVDGTDLLVWRDSTSSQRPPTSGVPCDSPPAWFPMDETSVLCFDEQENDVELCAGDETCFPYETQRVALGSGLLDLPFLSGWCRLDLNTNDTFQDDVDFPAGGSPLTQSYVVALKETAGLTHGGAVRAIAFGSACEAPAAFADLLFADDFESGGTESWSSAEP